MANSMGNTRLKKCLVLFLLWAVNLPNAVGWHLAQLGLNESYRVQHLSTHFTRVFLSISVESNTFPTLIESQWPVGYFPLRASIFPSPEAHFQSVNTKDSWREPKIINSETLLRDCSRLQKVIWSQVDGLNRLWVLDIGWRNETASTPKHSCPPKLIAYDLLRNNVEVLRIDCSRYIPSNVTQVIAIKLGPEASPCQIEKFVYFLLVDEPHIIAYDIIEQKWERRYLVSRKYANISDEKFPIRPVDIAFGRKPGNRLLIADADGILYSSNNALLRHAFDVPNVIRSKVRNSLGNSIFDDASFATPCEYEKQLVRSSATGTPANGAVEFESTTAGELEMDMLGSLLGPSRGMMVDYTDALFYIVPKFGAIVRSEYKFNMTAENNEIIYLTSKNIKQIFFGTDDSVWLLTDRLLKPHDSCFAGLD